jgi:hypothetical protein
LNRAPRYCRVAIPDKSSPEPLLLLVDNCGFCTDALFIRTESTVGARSAQWLIADSAQMYPDSSNCGGLSCADGDPPARITDCVRTRSRPYAIGDLG